MSTLPIELWSLIATDGNQHWKLRGVYHRGGDKPAIVYTNGDQAWYQHGELHRCDDK